MPSQRNTVFIAASVVVCQSNEPDSVFVRQWYNSPTKSKKIYEWYNGNSLSSRPPKPDIRGSCLRLVHTYDVSINVSASISIGTWQSTCEPGTMQAHARLCLRRPGSHVLFLVLLLRLASYVWTSLYGRFHCIRSWKLKALLWGKTRHHLPHCINGLQSCSKGRNSAFVEPLTHEDKSLASWNFV